MAYSPQKYLEEKATGVRKSSGAAKLKELTGKHLRAINLHLAGVKGREIAATLDMSEAWVSTVLNDPLAQTEIRQRFLDVDAEMFAKATTKIDDAMDSADAAISLRAAEMVWRSRGKFAQPEPIRTTAEDVVSRMLDIAAAQGGASVTISANTGWNIPPIRETSRPTIEGETEC